MIRCNYMHSQCRLRLFIWRLQNVLIVIVAAHYWRVKGKQTVKLLIFHFVLCYVYRPQRSWGKVIFSQASVILLIGGGGAIPACIAGDIPACLAAGLQKGGSAPGGISAPGGCLLWGVAFCHGLLLCPSVMAFWFGGLLIEGGHLVWSSGLVAFWLKVAIWYGLLGGRRP